MSADKLKFEPDCGCNPGAVIVRFRSGRQKMYPFHTQGGQRIAGCMIQLLDCLGFAAAEFKSNVPADRRMTVQEIARFSLGQAVDVDPESIKDWSIEAPVYHPHCATHGDDPMPVRRPKRPRNASTPRPERSKR
jgi:hypothetical protein